MRSSDIHSRRVFFRGCHTKIIFHALMISTERTTYHTHTLTHKKTARNTKGADVSLHTYHSGSGSWKTYELHIIKNRLHPNRTSTQNTARRSAQEFVTYTLICFRPYLDDVWCVSKWIVVVVRGEPLNKYQNTYTVVILGSGRLHIDTYIPNGSQRGSTFERTFCPPQLEQHLWE